jgi:hypothetical protein
MTRHAVRLRLPVLLLLGAFLIAPAQAAQPIWPGPPLVVAQLEGGAAIHGVAGDQVVLFALVPSASPDRAPGVYARRRLDGANAGALTPPSGGWGVPLSMKIRTFRRSGLSSTEGEALILDNRVPPALAGTQPARLYRYSYRYTPGSGLVSTLISDDVLPLNTVAPGAGLPNGLIYPGSIALLPDQQVVVTDNISGALWVSEGPGHWRMAAIDPRWAAAPAGPVQGVGLAQSGRIEPYTLLVPAPPGFPPGLGLYPGSHSIAYASLTDEVVWAVTVPGGIYSMPRSVLLDTSLPPFAKSGDPTTGGFGPTRQLVPPTAGLGDLTDGVDYDRFRPGSEWVYWQRAPADAAGGGFNTLRRVSLIDGRIQVVARDNSVYAWANEISVLPPLIPRSPFTTILSSVGQEYNNPDVNALLFGVPRYFAPSRLPLVVVPD